MAQYAAISGGTQLAGGLIQGMGQKQAMEDQRDYEARMAQEATDRYNANVGAPLWAANQPVNAGTGSAAAPWDALLEARAINARYATPAPGVGLIGRNMNVQAGVPMASNNYPVYNPYYANRPA
jgi:hypothetical protein